MDGKKGRSRSRRRRRRRGRKTKIEDLCDNMTVEILRSLPLRSIIRCLAVCKRWQSLIACNPLFNINTINVVTGYDGQFDTYGCLESSQRGGGIQQISELDLSFGFPNKRADEIYDYRILASCNGLHFSCHFYRGDRDFRINKFEECYISNPWTKESARLPNPNKLSYGSLFGLAFENSSSDDNNNNDVALYKIVVVYKDWISYTQANLKFEMYSSNENKWQWLQTTSEIEPFHNSEKEKIAVYCNRVLYWQCKRKYQALMLNLETETSGFLDLPGDINDADESLVKGKLIECDGQLHFIRIGSAGWRLNIWKMSMSSGGGGWFMLHNVDLGGAVESNLGSFQLFGIERDLSNLKPIGISCEGDDKVLLHNNYRNDDNYEQIVSYDLKKGVFELVLQRKKLKYLNHGWQLFRYTPTTKSIF